MNKEESKIETQNQNPNSNSNPNNQNQIQGSKGKSCKGCLYYSSALKSKSQNPTCVGIPRTLQQVPRYIIGESELEASKEGRTLTDFKYACVGYSVYLDNKDSSADNQSDKPVELPFCVGLEVLLDRTAASNDHVPANIHKNKDTHVLPQPRTQRSTPSTGDEFYNRFKRNAGLVASGVVKNMNKIGNRIKETLDDILYRRPKVKLQEEKKKQIADFVGLRFTVNRFYSGKKMVSGSALSAAAKQAEQLRKDGNIYFKKDRFGAAIDAYTEAITLCPNVPVYWTNRALCHRRRNDWLKVEEDCRRAIQLDYSSVKAHYMLGLALLQKQKLDEGVKELQKALDLGRGANPKGYMVDEIWQELAKAKYMLWEHASSKRSWELQSLKEACEAALREKHFLDDSQPEGFLVEAGISHMKQLEVLRQVFRKAGEADIPGEVPDYLCCKITLDIFRDPVITPSGVTYERAVILDHLQKVGKFDPITREPLDHSQLVPNLAMKEAVQAYLDKHGWAYKLD